MELVQFFKVLSKQVVGNNGLVSILDRYVDADFGPRTDSWTKNLSSVSVVFRRNDNMVVSDEQGSNSFDSKGKS